MYNYLVSENKHITPSVRLLTLTRKDPTQKPLLYQPGQYAAISLHDQFRPTTTRCFSLASSPTQGDVLQFGIRVKGVYTSALERLEKGDKIFVRGPFGYFIFNEHVHDNVVFFAGGIGITPFISMIRYASDVRAKSAIHLVYSCRSENDIPFLEELLTFERLNPNLRVTYVVSDGEVKTLRNSRVFSGSLDDSMLDKLGLLYEKETYMVCGPPPYMEAVQKMLKNRNVSRSNILSEAFGQGASNQSSRMIHWPVNAYALSGLVLLLTTGLIVGADINKTLPKLEEDDIVFESDTADRIKLNGGTIDEMIHTVPPQVDTDVSQDPIITYVPNPKNALQTPVPVVTPQPTPKPTPAPLAVKKPAPTPTPVVVTTKTPKSTVS